MVRRRPGASLFAEDDARFCEVVGRKLHRDLIARDYADEMFPHFARDMCKHIALAGKIDTEHGSRQDLRHCAFSYNWSFLCHCRRSISANAWLSRVARILGRARALAIANFLLRTTHCLVLRSWRSRSCEQIRAFSSCK